MRTWGVVDSGIAAEVRVKNGLPWLRYIEGGGTRLASYPDELSRVFVKNDAPIDPEVFKIRAPRKIAFVPSSVADVRWEWDD